MHSMWTRIEEEARRSYRRYGDYTSTHEAYGVLAEEVAELLDAICTNDLASIAREAIQVSAVAGRLAAQCDDPLPSFRERSGG